MQTAGAFLPAAMPHRVQSRTNSKYSGYFRRCWPPDLRGLSRRRQQYPRPRAAAACLCQNWSAPAKPPRSALLLGPTLMKKNEVSPDRRHCAGKDFCGQINFSRGRAVDIIARRNGTPAIVPKRNNIHRMCNKKVITLAESPRAPKAFRGFSGTSKSR